MENTIQISRYPCLSSFPLMTWCLLSVGNTLWALWVVNTLEPLEGVDGLHLRKASLASGLQTSSRLS